MPRLLEQTVQVVAQQYLQNRYKWRAWGKLFSKLEVRTKKRYGGKRADGLLVFHHWLWGLYVVSMEAKSFKTLPAIKPYFEEARFLKNCAKAGLVFTILTGSIFYLFTLQDGFVQFLLPLVMFLMGALLFGLLTYNSAIHKNAKVLQQIDQYPANEQWLAISIDSEKDLSSKKMKALLQLCKAKGVGILVVHPSGKLNCPNRARMRWQLFGDYLNYYSLEVQIKQYLGIRTKTI